MLFSKLDNWLPLRTELYVSVQGISWRFLIVETCLYLFNNLRTKCENQFRDSIEDWRKAVGLEKMILLGHSFGGYLATSYSLCYKERVRALILIDPWGFSNKSEMEKPISFPLLQSLNPLDILRFTGQLGMSLYRIYQPEFINNYKSILDNPEIVYSYIYCANNRNPR